jgi:hypothetical protein
VWALGALLSQPFLNSCLTAQLGAAWADLGIHNLPKADETAEDLF